MSPGQLFAKVCDRIQKYGFIDTLSGMLNIAWGLGDYYLNPGSMRTSKLPPRDWGHIRLEMEQADLRVVTCQMDVASFRVWLDRAAFPDYYVEAYGALFIEKALEHYVGAELLGLSENELLVDAAASNSPWLQIAPRLYGVNTLAIDLLPPAKPMQGNILVTDATKLPLKESSVDGLILHCAYEMFEGDSDSRLLPEAARVLRSGGRLVILPLYMHHLHYADSSPGADRRGLDYQGAARVWREEQNGGVHLGGVRFSRKYDVPAFMDRVVSHADGLDLTIYFIENESEVDPRCYLKMAAVFEKNL